VSEELNELIEMARTIRMTPEQGIPCLERREAWGPRRSFAYSSVKIENDSITWEMIAPGGGGVGREVSGRPSFCPVWRFCGA